MGTLSPGGDPLPGPYFADLRSRVLAACGAREGERSEIAERFRVSESTFYLGHQQRKLAGRTEAEPN
jgi:transposase